MDYDRDLNPDPLPSSKPGRYFSIGSALRSLAFEKKLTGLEAETDQELRRRIGPPRFEAALGFRVPWDIQARALTTATGAGGIPTRLGPLIDILRAKLVTASLGASTIEDLRGGALALPRKTATVSLGWFAESGGPASPSIPRIDQQATFSPHSTGAYIQVTRTVLASIPEAESILIDDIIGAIAVEVDRVALNGSGLNNEPTGILNTVGIGSVALGANGGAPTRDMARDMEQILGNANADIGSLGWVGSPNARFACRGVSIGGGFFLWGDNGRILEYPATATANVPNNLSKGTSVGTLSALILANWRDLVIGLWGPAYVSVNPYKYSSSGFVEITAIQDLDIALRHNSSFVSCNDIVTT